MNVKFCLMPFQNLVNVLFSSCDWPSFVLNYIFIFDDIKIFCILSPKATQWRHLIFKKYFVIFIFEVFSTNFLFSFLFFKNILFIYSWETWRVRQRHRQRKKQASCGEPNVGLDLRTPGSRPEPKADALPLSYPGAPPLIFLREICL